MTDWLKEHVVPPAPEARPVPESVTPEVLAVLDEHLAERIAAWAAAAPTAVLDPVRFGVLRAFREVGLRRAERAAFEPPEVPS